MPKFTELLSTENHSIIRNLSNFIVKAFKMRAYSIGGVNSQSL